MMSNQKEKLVILIPCYNEEHNIEKTLDSVLNVCNQVDMQTNICLIDDGSTDNTRSVMQSLSSMHPEVKLVSHDKNHGVGYVVKSAIAAQDDESWVSVIPGDNEIKADSLLDFIAIRHDYDLILGYFKHPVARTLFRRFCSSGFMVVIRILYGFPYRYINGLKLYRAKCFKGITTVSTSFAYTGELIAKAILKNPGIRIGEAAFVSQGRVKGKAKAIRPLSIIKSIVEVIKGYSSVSAYRKIKKETDI